MRSWTDRLVLGGLAVIGGGLLSFGTGKAIARYTISGSPVLVAAADASDAPPTAKPSHNGFVQLADTVAPPPEWPPQPD